jgi:hypothetical protein
VREASDPTDASRTDRRCILLAWVVAVPAPRHDRRADRQRTEREWARLNPSSCLAGGSA